MSLQQMWGTCGGSLLVDAVPRQEQVVEAEGLADGLCLEAGIPSIIPACGCVRVLPQEAGLDSRQQMGPEHFPIC